MGQLNEEAFHTFFKNVLSPTLRKEEESIKKITQQHKEQSEENENGGIHMENTEIENRLTVINEEINELSCNDFLDRYDLSRLEDLEAEYNTLSEKLDGTMGASGDKEIQ